MKVIRGIPPATDWTPCALTIGNFDGVHRGHQALLKKLVAKAKALQVQSCVMTFEPHPIEYFAPEKAPARILGLRDKLEALAEIGIDQVLVIHFNQAFANLSPEAFVKDILVDGLKVKSILIGDDFHYGAKRAGNFSDLQIAGQQFGFSVERMETLVEDQERISSSAIRLALQNGQMDRAQQLLGRPYMLSGHVLHGQKLGRTLGFPTLNLAVANRLHKRKPAAQGIFIAQVHGLSDNPLPAVASQGVAFGSAIARSLYATTVFEPFSKTVTLSSCDVFFAQVSGSASIASELTVIECDASKRESSPACGVMSVG